jgi:hypothetical protein
VTPATVTGRPESEWLKVKLIERDLLQLVLTDCIGV